ncbi:MAG: hypothetical protein NZO16_03245, partial [Deltaproteobacteria bacterium]|nr:hypothetical protein [Deltaproteobacteria bacterium]
WISYLGVENIIFALKLDKPSNKFHLKAPYKAVKFLLNILGQEQETKKLEEKHKITKNFMDLTLTLSLSEGFFEAKSHEKEQILTPLGFAFEFNSAGLESFYEEKFLPQDSEMPFAFERLKKQKASSAFKEWFSITKLKMFIALRDTEQGLEYFQPESYCKLDKS